MALYFNAMISYKYNILNNCSDFWKVTVWYFEFLFATNIIASRRRAMLLVTERNETDQKVNFRTKPKPSRNKFDRKSHFLNLSLNCMKDIVL